MFVPGTSKNTDNLRMYCKPPDVSFVRKGTTIKLTCGHRARFVCPTPIYRQYILGRPWKTVIANSQMHVLGLLMLRTCVGEANTMLAVGEVATQRRMGLLEVGASVGSGEATAYAPSTSDTTASGDL